MAIEILTVHLRERRAYKHQTRINDFGWVEIQVPRISSQACINIHYQKGKELLQDNTRLKLLIKGFCGDQKVIVDHKKYF